MKLVGFKQKHLNGTDFIWRLFFFFVVIIIMVVSFNLTDFFSWNALTHFQMTRMRKWWVVILLKYRFYICTDVWKQLGIYLANIEFFSTSKLGSQQWFIFLSMLLLCLLCAFCTDLYRKPVNLMNNYMLHIVHVSWLFVTFYGGK